MWGIAFIKNKNKKVYVNAIDWCIYILEEINEIEKVKNSRTNDSCNDVIDTVLNSLETTFMYTVAYGTTVEQQS